MFFFFTDTPTTEIYTLSLHDALPISDEHGVAQHGEPGGQPQQQDPDRRPVRRSAEAAAARLRSEEHTSELQSRFDLVCRLLLEKKKKNETEIPLLSILVHILHLFSDE